MLCRLECHYMAMLAAQRDLNCQDGLDLTIPRISKEDMKRPIPVETPVVEYTGRKKPRMPLAATNQFDMSNDFVKATKVSLYRAQDLEMCYLKPKRLSTMAITHGSIVSQE